MRGIVGDILMIDFKKIPDSDKPRERLYMYGSENLSNEELISIILKTGTKKMSVKEVALKLLEDVGDIDKFKDAIIKTLKPEMHFGKIDKKILKALFKVVIDDTEYEIASRSDYVDFLKTEIKRMKNALGYFHKMMACKEGTDKHAYYKAGVQMYLYSHEDPYKVEQMLAEFKATYKNRQETIQKLYLEVKEIKKLTI